MNSENKINVLYLDDEENNLFSFKATFRFKYNVFIASKGAEALDIIRDNEIHVIITDQRMPEMTGVEFLEEVIKIKPEPIRILLTGYTDMAAVVDAINKGKIFHYLNKPWKEEEISETVSRAFEIYEKKKNIIDQNSQLEISNEQLEFLLRQKLLS
ncbi:MULTISPECIES: response regulator [Sphingobacterium]|jgi:response regulator RpfG family c-di-GMP phosphodiesterase|uniref:response regulator n=1 Tax=Sphingobacterium TaxID=28453 RepID=UPI000C0BC439|nr:MULTISPECIES: response regulator [Sphingobacterium]MCT1531550.1 response regulator [Sphingobacterium daejeonense]